MSRGALVTLAILAAAAGGPAGFFAYRALTAGPAVPGPGELTPELVQRSGVVEQPSAADAQAPGQAPGQAPAQAAQSAAPPIPEDLPDLTFPDARGTSRKLSEWRGRPLIVNFWATWCEPCRREIPLLESLLRDRAGARLQIVGIAVDDRDPALKYARQMRIDYPVLIGGEDGGLKAIDAFGMAGVLPFSVFADTRGRILTVKVGELHPDEARLILARLLDVDAGRLSLPAAREQIEAGLESLAVHRAQDSAGSGAPPAKS